MSVEDKIPAYQYALESFAELRKEQFDQYIEYKVHGYHSTVSFRRVFGAEEYDGNAHIKIDNVETNPYYTAMFKERMEAVKTSELWNTKISINELLGVARNPFGKDTAKLAAMKELNIMCGITVVDDSGKTRAGRSLDDFYAMQDEANPLSDPITPPTAH